MVIAQFSRNPEKSRVMAYKHENAHEVALARDGGGAKW
jgi:hypothetical protein